MIKHACWCISSISILLHTLRHRRWSFSGQYYGLYHPKFCPLRNSVHLEIQMHQNHRSLSSSQATRPHLSNSKWFNKADLYLIRQAISNQCNWVRPQVQKKTSLPQAHSLRLIEFWKLPQPMATCRSAKHWNAEYKILVLNAAGMGKYVHQSVQWNSYWYLILQASYLADAQWNIQRLMHGV
jgi:hypothetical protein